MLPLEFTPEQLKEINEELHRIKDDAGHYDEPWWLDLEDTDLFIVDRQDSEIMVKQYMSDTSHKRELPFDMEALMQFLPYKNGTPENEWQALMEAAPGDVIETPKDAYQPIKDIIIYALDELATQDKYIVDAINYEQISFEELGKRLGCSATHAWRLKNAAYESLRDILMSNELIKEMMHEDV